MLERDISEFLHKRICAILMMGVAVLLGVIAFLDGEISPLGGPIGIGITPPREWPGSPLSSLLTSLACTASMGVLMLYINREYNIFRSLTSLVAGLFFIMQTALPPVMCSFYSGDMMGVMILIGIVLLFSGWSDPESQRRVFLLFFLISLAGFTDLSYLLYIPVFLIGLFQMRIFTLRNLLAALLGLITPPWILFGFGALNLDNLHMPRIIVEWSLFHSPEVIHALTVTGFTITLAIGFSIVNLLKILSYNSRVRAYNGFLTLMLAFTGIFSIINFNNFAFYIPMLNCLTAYQIAHFFTYRRTRRSYIPILLIIAVYICFYLWYLL